MDVFCRANYAMIYFAKAARNKSSAQFRFVFVGYLQYTTAKATRAEAIINMNFIFCS